MASSREMNPVVQFLRGAAAKLDSRKFYDAPLHQYVAAIVHRAEFLALADDLDGPQSTIRETDRCYTCGHSLASLRVPGVPGSYCDAACVETHLFGEERCRWCGSKMEKPYTSIDSRLCSEDCSANYYAHVRGDGTAALGTRKRLLHWLQVHQPMTYRKLIGIEGGEGYCQNPACRRGEDGRPASLSHLRTGTLYCSTACKMQMRRAA